jgi:hypothetical protein
VPTKGDSTEHDAPPGDAVTVYSVIAAPPSLAGANHDTLARRLPGAAVTSIGASGTVRGVTSSDGEGADDPEAFDAVTATE